MPVILNSFLIRLIAFSLILIIITPPFNTWEKLIILSLSSTVIFFSEIINYSKKKLLYISLLVFVFFVINFSYKNYIIVNQIVLPTTFNDEFDYVKKYLPNDLEKILKTELKELEKKKIY